MQTATVVKMALRMTETRGTENGEDGISDVDYDYSSV